MRLRVGCISCAEKINKAEQIQACEAETSLLYHLFSTRSFKGPFLLLNSAHCCSEIPRSPLSLSPNKEGNER